MCEPYYQETMQQKHMYLFARQGLKTQIHLRHCLCTQGASSSKFLTNFESLKKGNHHNDTTSHPWECGETGTLAHGSWECKMAATLEKVWHFLKKLNMS